MLKRDGFEVGPIFGLCEPARQLSESPVRSPRHWKRHLCSDSVSLFMNRLTFFRCLSWLVLVVLLTGHALASSHSSMGGSAALPSPTRAEPGRQSAEWGGDAFLSSSKAGGRVRSEGEAQPAQAQAPPLELNVGHHLCAEQAGGWGLTLPELGRYLSPEPLGLMGGMSPFGYAKNDPIQFVDPDGLEAVLCTVTAGEKQFTSSSGSDSIGRGKLHPVVEQALAKDVNGIYPAGKNSPTDCAEPYALSQYLYDQGVSDNGDGAEEALAKITKISAEHKDSGVARSPCPNCSQLLAKLQSQYGEPTSDKITKGFTNADSKGEKTNFESARPKFLRAHANQRSDIEIFKQYPR